MASMIISIDDCYTIFDFVQNNNATIFDFVQIYSITILEFVQNKPWTIFDFVIKITKYLVKRGKIWYNNYYSHLTVIITRRKFNMKKHLAVMALVGAATLMVVTIAYAVSNREYLERSLENYKKIYGSDENLFI